MEMKCAWMLMLLLIAGAVTESVQAQAAQCGKTSPLSTVANGCEDAEPGLAKAKQAMKTASTKDTAFSANSVGIPFLTSLAQDQKAIWTSPSRLRIRDANWLVPLGGLAAVTFATDRSMMKDASNSPNRLKQSRRLSNAGVASLVGAAGGLYLWGKVTQDEHKRETGFLAGESLLNTIAVSTAIQFAAGRQQPLRGNGQGSFFQRGHSFPSNHAAAAWSIASVVAHEYPGPLTKFLSYGLASAVSISRVTAKEHFPSDVLVGSALGWFIGQRIYRTRHNAELGGSSWGESRDEPVDGFREQPRHLGSPYVPLDSWVYPAVERLAAMGYVHTAYFGLKPWTRMECARLTEEAGEALEQALAADRPSDEAAKLYASLKQEFVFELRAQEGGTSRSVRLESVYSRLTSISGPALTDGFHFGQTISYDFGRPNRRGANVITGASASAAAGPFAIYFRGEYQHAPSAPPLSDPVLDLIAKRDGIPREPAQRFGPVDRFALIEGYVAFNLKDWQFSFGKQALSWNVGEGGSLLLSNNAEPLYIGRVSRVSPLLLPGLLKWAGPVRTEFFVGRLHGHTFLPRPYIYGQKITFKPILDLEISYGRTTLIGGGDLPVTPKILLMSLFGQQFHREDPPSVRRGYPLGVPGDSHNSIDWAYHIPWLGKRVTLYGELYADDDPSALKNLPKSVYRPGIRIARLPGLQKLDFGIEAANSESPWFPNHQGNLNYWNSLYHDGYTNNGTLMGNTVGRQGRSIQLWSNYWFSPRHVLEFSFKHSSVSPDFIPGGGYWQDYSIRHQVYRRSGLYVKSLFQLEHISRYPLLFAGSKNNVAAAIEIGFAPEGGWK